MSKITVDLSKKLRKIKPMHAVGQPPYTGGFRKLDFSPIKHLKNANIPYSRLHDVGGAFGSNRFVDIPNIFRDFDADEFDPNSYDFSFTDSLLEAMNSYGLKPIYRLGVTIENQVQIKALWIHPPKDYAKWARICEHIIRHYNEGWSDGFFYDIKYWEIWCEPENDVTPELNQLWTGTSEQFFELYDITSKHLKNCFGDKIKVGGYGSCGFGGLFYEPEKYGIDYPKIPIGPTYDKSIYRLNFFYDFLKYVKTHNTPLDFFSWHSYHDVEKTIIMDEFVDKALKEYGYSNVENLLDEWNNAHTNELHGSSYASAAAASMMLALQNSYTNMACYYDTRIQASAYGGFFAPLTYEPVSTYYSFAAFGRLYSLGTQVNADIKCDKKGLYAVAATNGNKHALMIANCTGETQQLTFEGVDFTDAHLYLIDKLHLLSMTFDSSQIANNTVMLIEW